MRPSPPPFRPNVDLITERENYGKAWRPSLSQRFFNFLACIVIRLIFPKPEPQKGTR